MSGPRSTSARSRAGSSTRSTASTPSAGRETARRRRGRADPAGLGRGLPPDRGAAVARRRRRRGRRRARRGSRDLHRDRAAPVPRARGDATSSTRPTPRWPRSVMAQLAARAAEDAHELCAVAIHHRVGRLEIGEASVVIAVSAPHRQAALACLQGGDRHASRRRCRSGRRRSTRAARNGSAAARSERREGPAEAGPLARPREGTQ